MLQLFRYLKPYTRQISLIIVAIFAAIMLELYLPTLMANLVDVGIVNDDMPYIYRTGGWMLVCALLAAVMTVTVSYLTSRVSSGFGRDVRRRLFVQVEGLSMQEFEKFGPASLITRTTNDIRQVQDVVNMMLGMMTRAPIMMVGGLILAISRDAQLSLIFLASLPILAGAIMLIVRFAVPLFGALQKKTDRLNLILRESLIGVRVIRAFNRVDDEKRRFNVANEDYRDTGIKVNRLLAYMFPVMLIVMNFTSISIIYFGGIRVDQGTMQIGNMMAFLQYAMMILMSLIMLSMALVMIPRAQASAKRINEVLQLQSSIRDAATTDKGSGRGASLVFKDVTFRYEGAARPVLDAISFEAQAGETTAIIGSTGAGKTTLLQMIPRFYDAESGSVQIGGTDVRQLPLKELRESIGYVPQKASLFRGTIEDNVRFGNEGMTEEQVRHALTIAQAADFVDTREGGLASEVSQGGGNLSGGQKQRLSIARALARKTDIYLFDDSFSALDYKTDARLRAALKDELREAVVLIVAQRISTVVDADQIIVLNEGKVAGIGTHDELLATNEVYQEIVASQQTKEESA
ncbi:ABC transporter ATP-binding protein [Paenibacillus daejeonensis]|uniref:ABC transporter ATP-binding protein n=1 Tax=Paenibacillus daejeonensis TaxID=135193 RepID=UPI00036F2C1E|nr:ABC transporter ATP-binding protein [Paenibacillus daejeonensis]